VPCLLVMLTSVKMDLKLCLREYRINNRHMRCDNCGTVMKIDKKTSEGYKASCPCCGSVSYVPGNPSDNDGANDVPIQAYDREKGPHPASGDTIIKKGELHAPCLVLCKKDIGTFTFVQRNGHGVSGGELYIGDIYDNYFRVERIKTIEEIVNELMKPLTEDLTEEEKDKSEDSVDDLIGKIRALGPKDKARVFEAVFEDTKNSLIIDVNSSI